MLPSAVVLSFVGDDPEPGGTHTQMYSRALHPGARSFLDDARKRHDDTIDTALKLYKSDSGFEMLDLCNIVLRELETSLNKNKFLSCADFFSICILDMVSRASEMAQESLSTADEDDDIQCITNFSSVASFKRSKALEILFGLVKPTSTYNAFEAISKATASKPYNRDRDGNHLLSYVESCLFKLKPRYPRPPQDTRDLQIQIPSASDKRNAIVAKDLPDRSAPRGGRKRGFSADSESPGHESQAASRQRLPATDQEMRDSDESASEDEC